MNVSRLILVTAGLPLVLAAQVTITEQDMFQPGQYWEGYGNSGSISSAGLIGPTGGPQLWEFSTGPEDRIYRHEYWAADSMDHAASFPLASFGERREDLGSGEVEWLFLNQVAGVGRENFGFYSEAFSPVQPIVQFDPPIIDFPATIEYGDTWTSSSSFTTVITGLDAIIYYTAESEVDAWGTLNLPLLGFGDCLRVNELSAFNVWVDLFGTGSFFEVTTEYVRSYFFLMEDRGIATILSSEQGSTPVPDQFTQAAQFVRMYETDHPSGSVDPVAVDDLQITVTGSNVLLNWSSTEGTAEYRVEYSDNPYAGTWSTLATTPGTFALDPGAATAGVLRSYRVIATN